MKLLWKVLTRRRTPGSAADLVAAARSRLEEGNAAEAARACQAALALSPDCAEALHLLGLVAHGRGEGDEALQHLERSVALDPGNASFRNNLGAVLTHVGRAGEAEAQ